MECSFEVVAEVVPLSRGASQAGSMCSASSSAGSEDGRRHHNAIDVPQQALESRPSSSSAALLASSLSGPLVTLGTSAGKPATDRALRARGKAMLRTQAQALPNTVPLSPRALEVHRQLSLESSSSMVDAGLSYALPSPSYVRASTAPLPGSLKPAGYVPATASPSGPIAGVSATAAAAAASTVHDDDDDDDDDGELVAPPAAAAAAAHQDADHCHWEDGVIASWLQGIDHTELLHDGEDDDEGAEEPASCSKAAAGAAAGTPATVFSSLLYK